MRGDGLRGRQRGFSKTLERGHQERAPTHPLDWYVPAWRSMEARSIDRLETVEAGDGCCCCGACGSWTREEACEDGRTW